MVDAALPRAKERLDGLIAVDKQILAQECCVCLDRRKTMCLMPCTHICLCGICANNHFAEGDPCPMCRTPIQAMMNTI